MAAFSTYTGSWNDMSRSGILGATYTISNPAGFFLIAGLSTLVALTGMSAWTIVRFILYQLRLPSGSEKIDGVELQHRVILRNSGSALAASADILRVCIAWRRHGSRVIWRTSVLATPILLTFVLFIAAGLLSGLIANSESFSHVLLQPVNCGLWNFNLTNMEATLAYDAKVVQDTINGREYAKSWYNNSSNGLVARFLFPVQALSYTSISSAECPFLATYLCILLGSQASTFDTGLLDSHSDFGINAKESDRVQYRKVVTCAPIHTRYFAQYVNGTGTFSNEQFIEVDFGPISNISNYTFLYDTRLQDYSIGYQLSSFYANAGDTSQLWTPIPALNRTDADVSVYFLTQSGIRYLTPVNDVWFTANISDGGFFVPAYNVTALGCTDQFEICNAAPSSNNIFPCTGLNGLLSVTEQVNNLELNPAQSATASRLITASISSRTFDSVYGLKSSALLAENFLSNNLSPGLPSIQWRYEVQLWFETSLAKMQAYIVEFTSNPSPSALYGTVLPAQNVSDALASQCTNQRVQNSGSTWNFSVLGVFILVLISVVIIIIGFLIPVIERFMGRVRRKESTLREAKLGALKTDDTLSLLRLAMEGVGHGDWDNGALGVPIAPVGYVFPPVIARDISSLKVPRNKKSKEGKRIFGFERKIFRRSTSTQTNHNEEAVRERRMEEQDPDDFATSSEERVLSPHDVETLAFYGISVGK